MLRILSTSLACIFGYPDIIDRKDLANYLKEKGYMLPTMKREEILTSSGFPIGEAFAEPPIVAYKIDGTDKIDILYNNNAKLAGFPSSSFVSVVSGDFERTYETFKLIQSYISERGISNEIKIYEATFTGLVEKEGLKEKVYSFLPPEDAHKFESVLHQTPALISFRIRGDNPQTPNWYDLMIDTSVSENPKLSLIRLVMRFSEPAEYPKIYDKIREIVAVIE